MESIGEGSCVSFRSDTIIFVNGELSAEAAGEGSEGRDGSEGFLMFEVVFEGVEANGERV